ncbi:sensor histidine kinase [Oligoflexus tunisiensis]|uniref:sensor histidine kinase n=1 Tax=Oligoflexus tunisiensis TaxID=708132 RepID=UPI00114CFF06|nr:HAMP domain-containing sensor histidine kinase [Oligoflexus tunisiensis]
MNILKIWQHPDSLSAPSVVGPRYLITSISFLNLLISCVYLVTNLRLNIDLRSNLVQIFGSIMTLTFLRVFRSHGPAAHMFLGMAVINACSLVLTFVDFPYTIVMWMPVFTILSVYLGGLLAGGVWSFIAITSVAMIVLWGKQMNLHPVSIAAADLPAITVITLYLTGLTAFIGSMFFARSINDLVRIQKQQNEELQQQNQTIQAYAQDKAMLVSIVVHDIATPLTIILHSSETAQKNISEAPSYLQRIHKAASIIHEISRSVREFQSVESGKKAVKLEPVDLHKVMDRARFIFEGRLQEKSLSLEFQVPDNKPLRVVAEEKSLSNSVINNLISNAIKFSHPGQKIVVSAVMDGEHVVLQIRDFGVGMPENKVKTVFSKQGVTSSKGTLGEKGTGFGLPISKAYVDKYGGEIRVESIEELLNPADHGTTFTLRLRRAPVDEPAQDSAPPPADVKVG